MTQESKNIIVDLSLEFALQIIEFSEILEKNNKRVIANGDILDQLISIKKNNKVIATSKSKN